MVPCLQSWMSMRWLAILCASAVIACTEDPGRLPPDDPPGDAAAEFTGLTLAFIADAELPAQISSDVIIGDIYLNGSMIRAVGDATTQDEKATTRHDYALHWDDDDEPRDLGFLAAPVGEYAYVELRIAGRPSASRDEAFEIRGEVRVGGGWTDFVIRADGPAVVATVPASMRLEANRPLTIPIELDVSRLVEGIDFGALPEIDGKLRLDEDTPAQLAAFSSALAGAFRAR
jgi:hypothetical protein